MGGDTELNAAVRVAAWERRALATPVKPKKTGISTERKIGYSALLREQQVLTDHCTHESIPSSVASPRHRRSRCRALDNPAEGSRSRQYKTG